MTQLAVLAAMGYTEILCHPRPRVVLIATGTAGPSGIATQAITHALAAGVREAGGIAYRVGAVAPSRHDMLVTLEDHLIRADLLLVCGGATLGKDGAEGVLPEVLQELGTVTFTPLAARPLGFVGFGTIGPDATPFFAVPNDPASALVAFQALIGPMIALLAARPGAAVVEARLAASVTSERGICDLVPVKLSTSPAGAVIAAPLIAIGGHPPLSLLGQADGLAVIPEESMTAPSGSRLRVMVFDKQVI